mgnify:CR=1 FL=1
MPTGLHECSSPKLIHCAGGATPETCMVCPYVDHPLEMETPRLRGPCAHLGAIVGTVECASCIGRVVLKTFACIMHGECTVLRKVDNMACCGLCQDFKE